jgi:hypothetical protein
LIIKISTSLFRLRPSTTEKPNESRKVADLIRIFEDMAIEFSNSASTEQEPSQTQSQQDELKKQAQQGMNGQEGMENGQVQGELELHRACAGGNLDEVRGVLSRGLEQLEILGMFLNCMEKGLS